MRIGYACLAVAVGSAQMKGCTLKNANSSHLLSLIERNLNSLEVIIDYNIANGIKLFRISSDLIPFGSGVAAKLPWQEIFSEKLTCIGEKIKKSEMRLSTHPGQYTVLNSPVPSVFERSLDDLRYHALVHSSLGLGSQHKIILHLGGAYNDKKEAKKRFVIRYNELDINIKKYLALENDDRLFNISDCLETSYLTGIPVVYDNLHNAANTADKEKTDIDWIKLCSKTWKAEDGLQKIHYSLQSISKKLGAHSDTIFINQFLEFYNQLSDIDFDIMLEVKDKNISALKCINCVNNRGIKALEEEWARYKYSVLERSAKHYKAIRQLLSNKNSYPALEMYNLIEESQNYPVLVGNGINAAMHIWGYFKDIASETEKKRLMLLLKRYENGEINLNVVKNNLFHLAQKYNENYLLNGYYFFI